MNSHLTTRRGFTLIEMLVSVSIVSFMLLMMAQFTGLTEQAWRMEQNRIDNFTKARSMLDLVTDDLQRAVFRGDLPVFETGGPASTPTPTSGGLYYFTGNTSAIAFYTRLPGTSGGSTQVRDVSLVSYVLSTNEGADKIALQRSDLYVPWTSALNISFQGNIAPLLQNTNPLEVAPGVVGFRLAFRRADGTFVDQSTYTGYEASNPVVAVDFALAVLDKQTLAQLSSGPSGQIAQIQTALASATLGNGIKASWDQNVLTESFYASYPKGVGAGLKTFERCVACTPF